MRPCQSVRLGILFAQGATMLPSMKRDAELERLRAEVARLIKQRDTAVAEREAAVAERDAAAAERTRLERLAAQLGKTNTKLEEQLAKLDLKYQQLCKRLFGRSSEKIDPAQLLLEFAKVAAEDEAVPPPYVGEAPDGETPADQPRGKKKRKGHGRRPRAKNLPRERIVHEPAPEELLCGCCGEQKTSMGSDEVTERYDYQPASLKIIEHVRPRYRCSTCREGSTVAPPPPAPIERGLAEPGLLAYVLASKFSDHLPLNRIRRILARHGVEFASSTLCDWVDQTAGLLEPIAEQVYRDVLSRYVVGMDETGIRIVFDRKNKKNGTRRGKIWVYRGLPGEVFYTISETKAHADENGPLVVLRGYQGYLQADADGTFDVLFEDGTRVEVGCNAHARRKFVVDAAKKSHPEVVAFVLEVYRRVYKVEAEVRGRPPDERLAARQTVSKPLLTQLDEYLDALKPTLVPGTPLAIAVNYSIRHRDALRRFLDHGEFEPDNNAVERALRLVAVGRKNWLFAGSPQAAKNAAILYTLVGGARDLGVEPWEYLRDVIQRVSTHPASRIAELTPRGWALAQSAASKTTPLG